MMNLTGAAVATGAAFPGWPAFTLAGWAPAQVRQVFSVDAGLAAGRPGR